MRVAAAILAGGRATRLGGARKPLLTVGGARIVDRQLPVLRPLCDEVVLLSGDPAYAALELRQIPDLRPGLGPLAGLEAALAALDADAVLLVGGDMPTLAPPLLARLVADAPEADAVAAVIGGRPQPLPARFHRRTLPRARALLDRGDRALRTLLTELSWTPIDEATVRSLDPALGTFANVNTPGELARLDALAVSPPFAPAGRSR